VKPLRVGLIVKNRPGSVERLRRQCGYFSYDVPEFVWTHMTPGKKFRLNMKALRKQGFDLIFHEDGGNWGEYVGDDVPVVYYSVDSTLSDAHYIQRAEQGRKADLILVDHDRLERFAGGPPVRRWSYCVNDKLFYAGEKRIDVGYHCNSSGVPDGPRAQLRAWLVEHCAANGYSLSTGHLSVEQYAAALGRARVVVNLPQAAGNRPHRVLDAMAAGAALLTAPLPDVSGEDSRTGVHYAEWQDTSDLAQHLKSLIAYQRWSDYAEAGALWMQQHTWAVRAQELRAIVYEGFGL